MGYHISRQRSFDDNSLYLEIATAKKHIGVDILTPRYHGENKTYVNPVDAIRLAIDIVKQWDKDYGDERKRLKVVGPTTPLIYECTQKGFDAATEWAKRTLADMKKCGNKTCGKVMGSRDPYEHVDLSGLVFCSEICIARKYRDMFGIEIPRVESNKDKLKKGILKI
jgi:hypothetical protein